MTGAPAQITKPPIGWVHWSCRIMGAGIVLISIAWAVNLPSYLGFAFYQEQLLALALGFGVAITFLGTSAKGHPRETAPWYDAVAAIVFLGVMVHVSLNYANYLIDAASRPTYIIVLGTIVVVCVMEALRRRTGWFLFAIMLVFFIYAVTAHAVPPPLTGRRLSLDFLPVYLAFDPSGVMGMPLSVAVTIVVLFIFFGEVLFRTGGGQFFTDLAMALVGRRRGGAAKIAVVSSALFGSISGSAVSNVATTGVVTVPLMRKSGYRAVDAGAIEAVASTGGQFLPPIMGAAAFLMAEFLNIDYSQVVVAALLPAILYYLAVFLQVHLMAGRDKIGVVADTLPNLWKVLRDGWHFFVPFVLLLVFLFHFRMNAPEAALYAAVAMLVIGFVRPYEGARARIGDLFDGLASAGLNTVELITIVAAAGFVIGILNSTGGGFAVSLAMIQLGGGNLLALLLIGGVICIVLGMGMPTAGVYVLLAALIAPAIVQAGVEPLAAHMFILYFGMMSMITPPIALACFAAATITGAGPMRTGIAAMRFGWVAYIVPFLFVLSPSLLMIGDPVEVAFVAVTAALGVGFITIAVVGFLFGALKPLFRLAFLVAGTATLIPASLMEYGSFIDISGAALGIALVVANRLVVPGTEPSASLR